MDRKNLDRAIQIGSDRGSSLSLDYFSNPEGDIFIKNPNDSGGIVLFADGSDRFFPEMPDDDFYSFDGTIQENKTPSLEESIDSSWINGFKGCI